MNLFSELPVAPTHEELFPGAVLMRGLAQPDDRELLAAVDAIRRVLPFRHVTTPSGLPMSVMNTACGSHPRANPNVGFRYESLSSGGPADLFRPARPPMPRVFIEFAIHAASLAGFYHFRPDSCLINRYQAGNKLGLHQDRHECDYAQPIVSVSLGLPAIFLLGGLERTDPARRILLEHGDVVVWGGPSRMRFHGVLPLKPGIDPLTGVYRLNLTFRKVA
jgi:DNA oxidative demethylase